MYLDLRHLGEKYLQERLPFICDLAKSYVNVDPAKEPIPVRPAVHYTMGGIMTDAQCETSIKGLYAAGECASVGLHGANRLGSNSLTELLVFGRLAGEQAALNAQTKAFAPLSATQDQFSQLQQQLAELSARDTGESWVEIKKELLITMEEGCGIYRTEAGMQKTLNTIRQLQQRFKTAQVTDKSKVYNTELFMCLELGFGLDIAEATCLGALERRESRGAHQRLDEGCTTRNDEEFLRHSLVYYQGQDDARLEWQEVDTSIIPPAVRAYGDAAKGAK